MGKYDDIINLPAPELKTRRPMPIADRAAQFSPFAAVVGHDAAIEETARLTEEWAEPDEYEKEYISRELQNSAEESVNTEITVEYFIPDSKKDGGKYASATGSVKKIKEFERLVIMEDGTEIPIDRIRTLYKN